MFSLTALLFLPLAYCTLRFVVVSLLHPTFANPSASSLCINHTYAFIFDLILTVDTFFAIIVLGRLAFEFLQYVP